MEVLISKTSFFVYNKFTYHKTRNLYKKQNYYIIKIGDSMNSIEISVANIGNNINIFIDVKKYKLIINNKTKDITEEQLSNLIRIIRTWNSNYPSNNNEIDTETFLIRINTDSETDVIKGNGTYPDNYLAFKEWIGEFND